MLRNTIVLLAFDRDFSSISFIAQLFRTEAILSLNTTAWTPVPKQMLSFASLYYETFFFLSK